MIIVKFSSLSLSFPVTLVLMFFFKRFLNNIGWYGYTTDNSLRPPSQKEVERNILSIVVLIIGIAFIIYIFN